MSHPISNVVTQDDVDHVMINDGGTTSHSPPTSIHPFFVQQRGDLISKSNFWLIHVKAHYRSEWKLRTRLHPSCETVEGTKGMPQSHEVHPKGQIRCKNVDATTHFEC